MNTSLIVIGYVVCGVLTYGWTFGWFQNRFPGIAAHCYKDDMAYAVFVGIFGPVGLCGILTLMAVHRSYEGFKFK
jgi:uncharacterized membrane protein YraQ (UPF0718 family)